MSDYHFLKSTPLIPASVYDRLPGLLKRCTEPFADERERDLLLTGSLIVLSGCFPSVEGKYGKDSVAANLFGFVVAPPANGKGSMKYANLLAKEINDDFAKTNEAAKKEYETALKVLVKSGKEKEEGSIPKKPKYQALLFPGNSSAASLFKLLDDNQGVGIISESEADALSGAIRQDWGNFSYMLRCAFHHEPLSISRVGNETFFSIEHPRLSILLTGTPDQVAGLISSTEDGLSSRFVYYVFSKDLKWMNPTPCEECPDSKNVFITEGKKVAKMKERLDAQPIKFALSSSQFSCLSKNFESKLATVETFEGAGAASAVYRLGLITFRIAMVLTVARKIDEPSSELIWHCHDHDFKTALDLSDVYFEHSMVMFSLLPKHSSKEINPRLRQFYTLLPSQECFPRKVANEAGKSIGLSERSVGNYLTTLVELGLLKNEKFGVYEKMENPSC